MIHHNPGHTSPGSLRVFLALTFLATGAIARDEPSVTLKTASAVRHAFESTEQVTRHTGIMALPAVVSERLFTRFISLSKSAFPQGGDSEWVKQHFALGRQGIGRYFVFAGDHTLIEKALVAGQFNPDQIMSYVGYGVNAVCSPSQFYWLIVFRPKSRPISALYEHNLQKWLNHVYGRSNAPNVDSALQDLAFRRFSELTACPLDPDSGSFNWSDLEKCAPSFRDSVKRLSENQCAKPQALRYSAANQCPTDQILKSFGAAPDALQLRAWLFATSGFSEFFTGYGYTGNFYNLPENREYWVDNEWLRNLPELELLKLNCTPPPSAQSLSATTPSSSEAEPVRPFSSFVDVY